MVYTLEIYLASVRDGQWFDFSNHNEKSYSNLIVHEGNSKPTEQECIDGVAALQAAWGLQEYARKRKAEYPSLLELTVALYDTDDKSAVEAKRAAVKAKYPKPE